MTNNTAQTLRPYQTDAIAAVIDAWHRGKTPLISVPTGGGKTTIFAELLVRHFDPQTERALVLADTIELVYQPYERIRDQFDGRLNELFVTPFALASGIGIVMADQDDSSARIVVATRQTLRRSRFNKLLEHGAFDIVVIDEAHMVAAGGGFNDIVNWCREANPRVRIMGCTATPKRSDKKALAVVFDEISYNYRIVDAIKDGFLVPPTRVKIKTTVDLSGIKLTNGDYKQDDLIAALDAANWTELAVQAYEEHILKADRPCLAYFPGVQESKDFTLALQAKGIPAGHIDGTTNDKVRADILAAYKQGDLRVVSNCFVLTKGFDAPHTSAILLARPTKSETLLTQIVGRGLRLFPGKKDCLVVDLTTTDANILSVATLTGAMETCTNPACNVEFYKGLKACPACGTPASHAPNLKTCPNCKERIPGNAQDCPCCGYRFTGQQIFAWGDNKEHGEGLYSEYTSLFGELSAAWYSDDEGYMSTSVGESGTLLITPPDNADGGWLRQRRQRGLNMLHSIDPELLDELKQQISMVERMIRRVDGYSLYFAPSQKKDEYGNWSPARPVEYLRSNSDLASLIAEADTEALLRAGDAKSLSRKDSNWRLLPASQGQVNYLRTLGVREVPAEITKGQAAQQISHVLALRMVRKWVEADTLPAPVAEAVVTAE